MHFSRDLRDESIDILESIKGNRQITDISNENGGGEANQSDFRLVQPFLFHEKKIS